LAISGTFDDRTLIFLEICFCF